MDRKNIKKKTNAEEKTSAILLPSVGANASQDTSKNSVHPAEGAFILEQTLIAKKLGISNNAFRRIAQCAKLEFKLINNKRCYDFNEVIKTIKNNRK